MALTITQTTATIERVAEIFSNAILSSETIESNMFQYIRASRDTFSMNFGSTSALVQDYSDDPSLSGTITAADAEFTIGKRSIKFKIDYDEFKNTIWKDAVADLKNQKLPPKFLTWLAGEITKEVNSETEADWWNGNGGLTGDLTDGTPVGRTYLNGFGNIIRTKLAAAPSQIITEAVAATVPSDSTKVQAILLAATAVIPTALVASPDMTIFVAPSVEQAYWESLSTTLATNLPQTDSLMFNRYKIKVIPNLNPLRIIIGKSQNMGVAVSVNGNDLLDLNVVDQYALGNGNRAFLTANYGYGAGIQTTDFVLWENTAA